MKINISNLSEGTHRYTLSKSAKELGLSGNFTGDIVAHVVVEKSTRQILLRATVHAQARFNCDRCADEFRGDLASTFETAYVWGNVGSGREESDDYHMLSSDTNIIDISKDVKEYVLLAVPLKLLCREECAGLCARCGKNLNEMPNGVCTCLSALSAGRQSKEVESRWSALEKLKKAAH